MDMKLINYSPKESSYKSISGVGSTLITTGSIIGGFGLLGGILSASEGDEYGLVVIASSVGFFLVTLFCYAICKGLSELVFRSYLRSKLDQHKMNEEELFYQAKN